MMMKSTFYHNANKHMKLMFAHGTEMKQNVPTPMKIDTQTI